MVLGAGLIREVPERAARIALGVYSRLRPELDLTSFRATAIEWVIFGAARSCF